MLYGVLPRPDARLLPQVLSSHPAPHPGPRTRPRASAPAPRLALWFSRSGPRIRSSHPVLASGPRIRSSHPVLALLSPHSCLRTPASALLPPHPGPHNPVLAPRLLAFRPASASHFDPRTPARTPVLHSGPVFREGRLLRFEPALRSSRPGSSHSALRRPRTSTHAPRLALRPRASAHAPRLALRSRVPGGALRSRAPVPCSGRRTPVPCSDPDLPPTFCPTLWAADSGGGSCPRAPSRISFRVPALAPRLLHSRPAFRAAVLKEGFRATFWNVAFRAAVLKEGGLRSGSCVRPRRCVSELRILANQQNKIYL